MDKQWLQCLLKALKDSLSGSSSGHEERVGKAGGVVGKGVVVVVGWMPRQCGEVVTSASLK